MDAEINRNSRGRTKKENPDERRRRLGTVRLLVGIVGPLDQRLSARVVAVLTQEARREAKAETSVDTDGLIDAAISLVEPICNARRN